MVIQNELYKICKYSVRLKNSYISNNYDNSLKYFSHLKHHIKTHVKNQIGNGNNVELDNLFDNIIKYINDNKDVYNIMDIENKLTELHENKYDKFINLLKEVFTKIYGEEIAINIIEEIGQAETWKEINIEKEKRLNEKVKINGYEYKWQDVIGMVDLFETDGKTKLITDIKNYLETGEGNINDIITQFNTELNKSTQKLKTK